MYQAQVRYHFDSAHFLRNYKGKCEKLHGHRFLVSLTIQTPDVDELGLSIDFGDLKKPLKEITEILDHKNLNEIPPFDKINPSSENLAAFFFREMTTRLSDYTAQRKLIIKRVKVWESPDAWASYSPDPINP
ncbi:MAG: 6-carboxytetrahydropterin synthase QueD [Candidatus Riflebacteria bacterium]|nr:6-carboxytetrahydropterin synthase QueD [Candidatus Riflebacteria bacterium]